MASTDICKAIQVAEQGSTVVHAQMADREYWIQAESTGTRPYQVFNLISDPHDDSFFGSTNGIARVQFDHYSTSRYKALSAAMAARKVIHHAVLLDSIVVDECHCSWPVVSRDPQDPIYVARFDALIHYREP